jgi:hypothetical protein
MLNEEVCGMPQVHIPELLFQQIKKVLPTAASADDFVVQAVRDKLSLENRRHEFYSISDATRAAMVEKGWSEERVLADFESFRRNACSPTGLRLG